MPFYAFHRLGHPSLIDPVERQLEVYALGRRGWELLGTHGGDQVVRAEPFDAAELDLAIIWPRRSEPRTVEPAASGKSGVRRPKARPR